MAASPKPIYIVSTDPSSGFVKLSDGRRVPASEARQYLRIPGYGKRQVANDPRLNPSLKPSTPGMSENALNAQRNKTPPAEKGKKQGAQSKAPAQTLTTPTPKASKAPKTFGGSHPASVPTGGSGGSGAGSGDSMDSLLKLFRGDSGNVNKTADAMTAAANDPMIHELNRQIGIHDSQAANRQTDTQAFFKKLVGSTQAAGASNDQALTDTLGSNDSLMANIAASLGADQQGQLAQRNAINTGELKAQGLSQHGFDQSMGVANAMRGRDESNQLQATDNAAGDNMKGQLLDLINKRGQDLVSNRFAVGNQQVQNKSAQINQLATLLLLPGQQGAQGDQHALSMAQIYKYTHPTPPTKRAVSGPHPSDYNTATHSALSNVTYGQDQLDADGNVVAAKGTPMHFNSTGDLVRTVNAGFVGSGLHSKDPKALAARNAILGRLGVQPDPTWGF